MRSAHPHDVYATDRLARLHASAARRRRSDRPRRVRDAGRTLARLLRRRPARRPAPAPTHP